MEFLFTHTPILYFTQSVWRDEAFSILLAQQPLGSFITRIAFEPPFYYILLHYWMKIFGTGEIAVRSLSLLGFSFACIVAVFWAERLFRKHWLSWFFPVFFFFNPLLLYYAFEARAYGWYMFFAISSMFAYMERKFSWYIVTTTLGLYTHVYMVFVPFVQCIHYIVFHVRRKERLSLSSFFKDQMIQSFLLVGLLFVPWFTKIIFDFQRLKESWYFPVDAQLVKSVLGNIFIGYEGTPHNLWPHTAKLSLILGTIAVTTLLWRKTRERNSFFFLMLTVPLAIMITISLFKPLFVMRYMMPAAIAQIFLITFAIERIKRAFWQKLAAAFALLSVVGFNLWYPAKHPKNDIRGALTQINAIATKNDVIMTDSPLILFETTYYSKNSRVYWYNPRREPFPWYIGDIIVSNSQIAYDLPTYPTRTFILKNNGTFEVTYNTAMSRQ